MKNRIVFGACAFACAASLSACSIEASPYTQEEIDMIGEYSALLIAGNNPDSSRLVDMEIAEDEDGAEEQTEEIDETEEPAEDTVDDLNDDATEQDEVSDETDKPEIDVVDVSADNTDPAGPTLEEFLQFAEGLTITYKGYECRESLTNQSGSYFYDPEEGNCFFILNYTVYNSSGSTQDVDFLYGGYSFGLNINGTKSVVAHEIPINEDLPTYIGRLADGTGVNLMITFECDSSLADSVESLKLTVKNSEGSCSIVLE